MMMKLMIFLLATGLVAHSQPIQNYENDIRGLGDIIDASIEALRNLVSNILGMIEEQILDLIGALMQMSKLIVIDITDKVDWAEGKLEKIEKEAAKLGVDADECLSGKIYEIYEIQEQAVETLNESVLKAEERFYEAFGLFKKLVDDVFFIDIPGLVAQALRCGINPFCYAKVAAKITQIGIHLTATSTDVIAKLVSLNAGFAADLTRTSLDTRGKITDNIRDVEKCFNSIKKNA